MQNICRNDMTLTCCSNMKVFKDCVSQQECFQFLGMQYVRAYYSVCLKIKVVCRNSAHSSRYKAKIHVLLKIVCELVVYDGR